MLRLVLRLILIASTLFIITTIVPGIKVSGFGVALFVAFLLAIVNVTLKPILHLITLPFILLTFGLFSFIVNGFLFWAIAFFVPGFSVESFWAAMLGSALLSLASWVIHKILV